MRVFVVLICLAIVGGLSALTLSQVRSDQWNNVLRARLCLERGRPDLALLAVSRINHNKPGAAEALTLRARAYLLRGVIPPARQALEQSLSLNLAQPEAAKLLAAIYLSTGDGQHGLVLLKKAAELDQDDFRPWQAMGKVHHDLGELGESADAYAQALRLSPPAAEARECRIGRVEALLDAKQAAQASEDLEALRRETPEDAAVLALAARQALDLSQSDAAMNLAERALKVNPDEYSALLIRARLRFLARDVKLAIGDLQKADAIKPNDVATLQLLVIAQKSLGLVSEAAATQKRADRARDRVILMDKLSKRIAAEPRDPEPRFRMGEAAMDGEMYVLAYQCFQAALDLDPRYKPAREALDGLMSTKGFDYAAAAKLQLNSRAR